MNRLRSTTGILMESVSLSRVEFHLDPRDCAPHRFHLGARRLHLLHQVFAERAAGHGLQARNLVVDPLVALRGEVPALHQRSEEHTSELQSLAYLVCRLLLEKKKNI